MHSRDIITLLQADGWRLDRVSGSHHVFVHDSKPGNTVVVHPRKDTPIGTVKSMERQSGVRMRMRR